MINWYKAVEMNISEVAPDTLIELTVAGKRVGLLKNDKGIYAFSSTCPHAGAPLCDGWIDALGRIVCPLHSYRFDPANGRNTSGEGYKLKTYPVDIRDGYIYIGLLES